MDWLDLPRKSNQNHAIIPCGRYVYCIYEDSAVAIP